MSGSRGNEVENKRHIAVDTQVNRHKEMHIHLQGKTGPMGG